VNLLPPSTSTDVEEQQPRVAVLPVGSFEQHGLKLGKAQAPVRVAVTGRTVACPSFESLEVLGKDRTLARIHAALAKLAG
jgi:glutamyl-tRNA synthetase